MTVRSEFSSQEIAYLRSQAIGRIATVDTKGRPRVVPTGFAVNQASHTIELSGRTFATTRRVQDIRSNSAVAFVVDDVPDSAGWNARGVVIRGVATLHDPEEPNTLPEYFAGTMWMSIKADSIQSWGLDDA